MKQSWLAVAAKVRNPPFETICVLCSIQKNGLETALRSGLFKGPLRAVPFNARLLGNRGEEPNLVIHRRLLSGGLDLSTQHTPQTSLLVFDIARSCAVVGSVVW